MSKSAGISGSIQPTGFNKSRKGSYYIPHNTVKRSETLKLRAGEVVQGTILDTFANNEASVRLPVGSFRCELHGNLKKGDELYFKVIEAHPVLYLKVYSVSVACQNKIRQLSEIIRILDLPDNNIYNSLIDFLISQKHIIIRDEALLIMRDYNELSESDLNNKSNTEIFRTIFWINESALKNTSAVFRKLYPLFHDGDYTRNTILKLYSDLSGTSDQAKLRSFLEQLNPAISFSRFLTFFSRESTFYKWLTELNDTGFAPKSASDLHDIIESMHYWNTHAFSLNNSFHLIVPIHFNHSFVTIRLILMNGMKTSGTNIVRQFQEKDPGVILASSSMISAVELEESYDHETLEKNLVKVAEDLSMIARNSNMSLQALLVLDEEGIVKDVLPSKPVSSAKNFSIVV